MKKVSFYPESPETTISKMKTTQSIATFSPRKGISNFLSRLWNRLTVLPLTMPMCLVMVLGVGNAWGQTSYLGLNGGFEGAATIDNTNTYAAPQTDIWSKANETQTLTSETTTIRSGAKSLKANNGTTGRRIWSPNISVASTTSQVTVQFYIRVASTTNSQEVNPGIINNSEGLSGSYSTGSANNTWTKITYSKASSTFTSIAGLLLNRRKGTGGDVFIDDMAVYTGAVDNSAPSNPTLPSVSSATTSSLLVSWTAASGGVDGGGYLVVRHTADPTTAPNTNGIYAVNNSIGSGTVVYQGTNVSFTDNSLASGTTYYYRIYTYDKAYNYSAAATVNGTTTSPTPSITLADNGSQVSASSVAAGATNVILHQSSLAVTTANATLTEVSFTTAGTYAAADVSNFKVWYSADNSFATTVDNTQLGSTITTSLGAGAKSVSSLSQAINSGSTGYIFITTDIAASPTGGNTINVSALTTSDISFSSGSKSGSTTAGGAKTLQSAASPTLNAGTISGSFGNICINTTSSAQSFTLSGSNLNGTDVSVSSTSSKYTFATSLGGSYSNPLTLTAYNGSAPGTIYVKFAPTTAGADNADISIAGGGTSAATVSQSSNSGVNTVPTVTTPTTASLSTTTVTLGGTISSIGCSNATTTGIYYSTSNGFADGAGTAVSTSSLNISSTPNVFTQAVTGLTANTQYYFKAFATNSGGNGYSSQGSFITFPTAPAGLSTGSITNAGFTVQWTDLTGTLEFYEVQIFSDAGFSTQVGSTYTTAANASSQAISGLSASTSYYYRVRAVNNTNQSSSYSTGGPVTTSAGPCLSENFETNSLTNWNNAGGTTGGGTTTINGTSGDYYLNLNENGEWTQLPSAQTYNSITFNLKGSSASNSWTLKVQTSSDGTTWNDEGGAGTIAGSSIGTAYALQTVTLSSITNFVRLFLVRTSNSCYIGNINAFCTSVPEINIKQSSNLVSGSGSFSLGTVTTGSLSSATTFTIENTGSATLSLTGTPKVAISGHTSDFTIDQTSTSATVSASGNTTFTVTFSPTTTGARSATISIANDDSNENPYTFTVTGTGATYAPSVTTSAATSITTTGATLNGNVTSDGGTAVTERGFVYKTTSNVTISDNKTSVAGTTGTFTLSPSLSVNTQYYFRAYAINSVNTTLGSELNFWTLANAPTAPTVNTPTGSSLNVSIGGVDGNSATTAYAIQETTSGNYVQANGSLAASAVWQTSSAWSSITVIGLSSATTYTFQVKARNGANTETAFGSTTNGTTSSIGLNAVILSSELTSTYGSVSSGVSFTASGTNLTSNITVTAQSGYQVSTDNNSFEASVSIASGTTVYVRFTSTRLAGNYNNEIALVLSGGGAASNANVSTSLSGNTVSKATPTVTSAPTATAITYGQTLASSTLSGGTASVAGAFTFTSPSTAPNAGTANQSVTFTPTDNTNYNTTTTNVSVTVNKVNQTITFGALADKTTDDTPFALTATASSGLTVLYSSSNTAVATVAGSTVTIVGAGQTTITASQAGDANYNAATSIDQTLTVTIPACITNSDQLCGWNFTTASPSTTISNLTIGDLTQGNNNGTTILINGTSASSVYTGASGGNNAGAASRTGSLNTGASGSAYFQFTLTPANGYNFTLTGISFGSRGTSTGPQAYSLRSSLDSYAADITTGSLLANSTWALKSNTGLNLNGQGNANPVTFRLYGYNGSGSPSANTANWRIDDLTLTVTVSNAPSSASVGSTQNLCGTLASATLGGNTPSLGTGTWTQTAGPGTTTFSNSSNGSSIATSSIEGAYTYKWSISNGCATVNEASVSVSFGSIPSAPTASAQSFCSSASPTIASLTATGSSIKWYDASTNGNLVASETALSAGNYYASQTVSSCESATRTSVAVTVNANGTWIGGELGEWNIANNWCGGVPNSNTAVVSIPAGVTIDLDASPSVLDLTVGSGSTLNLGGNTITIANGGAFTNNGTFNAQTGTVAFSGTGTLAGNATTFNNLTTNGNLNASASPTINGTLTLSSGTLSVGANTLTVNGSISTTSGNIDASNASATVVFGGSSAQTIPASTFTGNINNLTLSNSEGLTTNQSLTVANTLSLSSGILTLGTNNLTLTGSLHASNNGSSTSFINTNSTGAFIRSISSTGVDYKFPVGLSDYAPITVNFTGGTIASSTLASRAVSGLHPDAVDGAYIRSNLYWQMNQSGMTNPQYNVSFTYPGVTNGVGSSETEAKLLPAKYSASTGWLSSGSCAICYSGTTMGTSSINTETKTLTWNGVTGFSDFGGFGEGNGSPLPVELLSFNGICDENQIQLTWSTASESNSDYFEILKSQDGENWRAVNKQAAAGFSTTLQMYSFIETEKSNNAYYRLNQVDFNGDNKLYDPIFIDCEGNTSQLITYPNPSKNGFNIVISDSKLVGEATLIIRDAMGKEVLTKSISIAEGMNLFPIASYEIENGVYFITIEGENAQTKMIKHIKN